MPGEQLLALDSPQGPNRVIRWSTKSISVFTFKGPAARDCDTVIAERLAFAQSAYFRNSLDELIDAAASQLTAIGKM